LESSQGVIPKMGDSLMKQDYAEVVGVIAVSGLDAGAAADLAARGPMLGPWPADIRRTVRKLVGDAGVIDVLKGTPTVRTKRAGYDDTNEVPPVPAPRADVTPAAEATRVAMGSPAIRRVHNGLLMVPVGKDVWAIYPDGQVQSPKDGGPRPFCCRSSIGHVNRVNT
jgi:hypothetical protein